MAFKDVNGRSHPGMFEKIETPVATFTPTSGRGNKTQFKVEGPEATGSPDTIVVGSANKHNLLWKAEITGAIRPQTTIWDAPRKPEKL